MTVDRIKSVAIIAQSVRRYLFIDFSRLLKERQGCSIHLYSLMPGGTEFFERFAPPGTFDSVNVVQDYGLNFPEIADPEAVLEKARYYESRYGRSINWFTMVDRHRGRGYAPGGYYHPRSLSSTHDHIRIVDAYNRYFDFWEREFAQKEIDLVINAGLVEAAPARRNGVLVRTPSAARYRNQWYWATDEFGYCEPIERAFAASAVPEAAEELAAAPHGPGTLLPRIARYAQFSTLLRRSAHKVAKRAYWSWKGADQQYFLKDELRMFYRQWHESRKLMKRKLAKTGDLLGKRYVLYALQVEPEADFIARSPEYFYQMQAIISVSRDLPAGVTLAVKEHLPGIGRRPDLFYEQIRELKNVVLVDPREPGLDLVRGACGVATINGTVGQEAAVMGIPVVAFGRHNLYNVVPHVTVITDEAQLGPALRSMLSEEFDRDMAYRNGQRFLAALRSVTFDMKNFGYADPKGYDGEVLEAAYGRLVESLPSSP